LVPEELVHLAALRQVIKVQTAIFIKYMQVVEDMDQETTLLEESAAVAVVGPTVKLVAPVPPATQV
jgi:hypothetical protein